MKDSFSRLERDIVACRRCPRLRDHCETIAIEKRRSFRDQEYWGKPVPDFGDPRARLLIVGLAPAAHGANRTGRMFTGDRSGAWLYRALHRAGFANQPTCANGGDGLKLRDCVISAVAHCAPPDNKPTPKEIANCSIYLQRCFALYSPHVVIALGALAWRAVFDEFKHRERWQGAIPKFSHAGEVRLDQGLTVLASYHPSQQNTFTGRLTETMFDHVFKRAQSLLPESGFAPRVLVDGNSFRGH